jgi:ketosteroid isomerase-like protein
MRGRWLVGSIVVWLAPGVPGASYGAEPGAGTRDLRDTRDTHETRDTIEREVLRLDAQEADAVLRGDFALVEELWADDFVVNNPFNTVSLGREGRVRMGVTTYTSFERVAEVISLRGDVVFVMGHEVVVPKAPSADAGRTVHRRYTNVWIKTAQGWKLAARHANVIART